MYSSSKVLVLTDNDLIGAGAHKATYIHPQDKTLCVKIARNAHDVDLKRELAYRSIIAKQHKIPTLMPFYHGTIETNKGIGHIFERIFDCDGQTSLTLDIYIRHIAQTLLPQEAQAHFKSMLAAFKAKWFEEKTVTSNIELVNFMVQHKTPDNVSIRIVDNIGTPVLIPLAYYSELFAKKRVVRYWKRFLQVLGDSYPEIFTKELLDELA